MEEVKRYTAIVERDEPGWAIYVPEVDRHTWAANLREIDDMARDLVQVMTNEPIDEIDMALQLPSELASQIEEMHAVRARAEDADAAARETQRSAAVALRAADAPLRDIAAMIGVSHQRVHQILADADRRAERLHQLKDWAGTASSVPLPVTDDEGNRPVVVALSDELLATLIDRLRDAGGFANVFIQTPTGLIEAMSVVRSECAIGTPDDDLSAPGDLPHAQSTVGMFLAYVRTRRNGVAFSSVAPDVRATDVHTLETASC